MGKITKGVLAGLLVYLLLPSISLAATVKSFSGTVTKISGSQIFFSTTSAANYSADVGNAQLVRKNGSVMALSDILVGDKITVKGTLWPDNSISATSIQDNSLYAHTGTFTGKITSINPSNVSFVINSKTNGPQTIYTTTLTSFSENSGNSNFNSLGLGMTATVKGVWDRSNVNITASSVTSSFRLINIYFTGTVSIKNGSSITVVGNGNVIYGVDLSKATLENKNGSAILLSTISIGDSLRVWGKHISGGVQVVGTKVKDSSLTK